MTDKRRYNSHRNSPYITERKKNLVFDHLGGKENLSLAFGAKDFDFEQRIYTDRWGQYDKSSSDIWRFKYGEDGELFYKLEVEHFRDYRKKLFKFNITKYKYEICKTLFFFKTHREIESETVSLPCDSLFIFSRKEVNWLVYEVEDLVGMSLNPFGVLQ